MNKLIMALALVLAPFFSQFSSAAIVNVVEPESVPPKSEAGEKIITSDLFGGAFVGQLWSSAQELCEAYGLRGYDSTQAANVVVTEFGASFDCIMSISWGDVPEARGVGFIPEETKSCPPDDYPAYIYPWDSDDDGEIDKCFKENPNLDRCPDGNYKFKIGGECVPVQCSESGTQASIWAAGSVYNNTTGTYCDGSCAHSVTGGQNNSSYSGNVAITAVSTGAVCGQGADFWHNEGNGEDCQSVVLGSGASFVSCPNGDTPEAPASTEPTIDLEPEEFALEEITPLIPNEETCTAGDSSCEIRNLKETILTKGLEQKEIDKILHNKKIAADEKTSTKIIDGIADSTGRNLEGLEMVTAAINGLKGEIGGGGGSNGDGFGDGDVTCDGDDCEGGILTDIEPTAGLVGYWESEYEDGLQGVFDDKLIDVRNTEFFGFIDKFNPAFGAGSAPSFEMCFNMGALGNFGCKSFILDSRVFPAIRIFILITAGFLCRKILFGG